MLKWLVTTAVLVAVLVPAAYATGQALDPRVPALKRQLSALTARVNAQDAELDRVDATATRTAVFARCIGARQAPIARYQANVAYGAQGGQYYLLTFLDFSDNNGAVGFVPFPQRQCSMP
jgi:hypothetical protein